MYDAGLHFDPYQFAARRSRPASKETGISFDDYARMSTHTRSRNLDRRLPTPAWALSDVWLRKLLILFLESRAQMRSSKEDIITRRDIAERKIKERLPQWNATLDTLQHEYVEARREGAAKEALKNMEVEIENLDTLIRVTQKGTLATLAAVVVLYYRMRKNSVEVAEELQLKPPHVRMLLFRLHELWNKNFNIDFTVEPAAPEVPPCRSYTREEIDEMLAAGKITIPKDTPKQLAAQKNHRAAPQPIDAQRAAQLRASGMMWKEIATELGCSSAGSVLNAVRYRVGDLKSPAIAQSAYKCKPGRNPIGRVEVVGTDIRVPGESRKEQRARRIAVGLCGYCGKNPREDYSECAPCRAYFAEMRKNRATAKKATPLSAPQETPVQSQCLVPA